MVDGDLIHSRKATGEYADPERVLQAIRDRSS
jgi:predicted Rdx family selenoprotein